MNIVKVSGYFRRKPIHHKVKKHIRDGYLVHSYEKGSRKPTKEENIKKEVIGV